MPNWIRYRPLDLPQGLSVGLLPKIIPDFPTNFVWWTAMHLQFSKHLRKPP